MESNYSTATELNSNNQETSKNLPVQSKQSSVVGTITENLSDEQLSVDVESSTNFADHTGW